MPKGRKEKKKKKRERQRRLRLQFQWINRLLIYCRKARVLVKFRILYKCKSHIISNSK